MMDQSQDQLIKDIIKMTLYVLSLFLNLFLLFMLWRDPIKRFRNTPSYLIANLALADIIAAVGGLGGCIAVFTTDSNEIVHKIFGSIATAGLQSSFLIVATLAFDRYLAINHPYQYKQIFGQTYWNTILNVATWILACTIGPLVYFVTINDDNNTGLALYHLYVTDVCVLALVTSIFYPLNYWSFLKAKKRLEKSAGTCTRKSMEDLRLANQLNQTWIAVALFFFLAMVPYVYFLVININNCETCMLNPTFIKFWINYQVAFPAIFFVNPLVYAWRLPIYRRAFKALLLPKLPFLISNAPSKNLSSVSNDRLPLSSRSKEITSTFVPTTV